MTSSFSPTSMSSAAQKSKDETMSSSEASSSQSDAGSMSTHSLTATKTTKDEQAKSDKQEAPLRLVADLIKQNKAKRIVVLAGAGISTSAGIPDFRSPDTGLYANLAKLKLPYPEAVFDIGFFKKTPEPFWTLAKELYPGKHYPTPTHYFLSLLHSHAVLSSLFTQNIDTLESLTPLPRSKIIEAHGSFASSHCLTCGKPASSEYVLKSGVRAGETVRCTCGGLVKPDIVFFGEGLPKKFFDRLSDLKQCDLLIVIGTSLQVQPFAGLVDRVPKSTPRILINREAVGPFEQLRSTRGSGRDHIWLGDADSACQKLAALLGWEEELETAIQDGHSKLKKEWGVRGKSDAGKTSKEVTEELSDLLTDALKIQPDPSAK